MVIISQDKTMILNFEYIETIEIRNPLENNDGKFKILCDTTSDNQYTIAEYEKEERAKEVLQQIACRYSSEEIYKRANSKTQEELTRNYVEIKIIPYIFEMPER